PAGGHILDLGCGAGTLGLVLAAGDPQATITMVDTSQQAVDLARENALANCLARVEGLLGDGYTPVAGRRFDAVIGNLPAHRGYQADSTAARRFIVGAPAHLRVQGAAWFVANKALPYETVAAQAFREVDVVAANGRYKVLRCAVARNVE